MGEVLPLRRRRAWTRAEDYGVPRGPRRGASRGKSRKNGWGKAARESGPLLIMLPLAAFAWVLLADDPLGDAQALAQGLFASPPARDSESAHFAVCGQGFRETCVIDGDTFWYRGEKIRVADINTPETSSPQCVAEARLGARATERLVVLLNAGPFSLEPVDRERDRYGRVLRTVTRDGKSVGEVLVGEGLAEAWVGYRRDWCGGGDWGG